jgi:hypothetical protein
MRRSLLTQVAQDVRVVTAGFFEGVRKNGQAFRRMP